MEIKELQFPEGSTTRQQLIQATQVLIASYGYEGTTTRMIANLARVTLSTINFHFGSKEALVKAAIEQASEDLRRYYSVFTEEIAQFLKTDPDNSPKAWDYIDRLLRKRIHNFFHPSSQVYIGLIQNENTLPDSSRGICSAVITECNERVLAQLILAVDDKKDALRAIVLSRSINGSIMTFMEKPLLLDNLLQSFGLGEKKPLDLADMLHNYFMCSLKAMLAAD